MLVSLALIVRDEERTLPRCLDSVRGAVDEIVVVDTGSVDATRDVARRYTDRVFEFTWIDDFSAARQFAFDQASGDWVGWMDADDVVTGGDRIRSLAAAASADTGGIYWPYVIDWDDYGNPTCRYWRERLVRNDGSYRWQGRVHEVLTTEQAWKTAYSEEVIVEHHPTPRGLSHTRRNLSILEAEYATCRQDPPPRLLFYLAREYAYCGENDKALEVYAEHLDCSTWDEERYQAMMQVAALLLQKDRSDEAIDSLLQALKVCPHWPDAYFALARAYYFLEDWHRVVHWTEVGRAMPKPETLLFTNPMDYRFNWMIYYTNALYHLGELEEAWRWTQFALQICPADTMHLHNLAFFQEGLAEEERGSYRSEQQVAIIANETTP